MSDHIFILPFPKEVQNEYLVVSHDLIFKDFMVKGIYEEIIFSMSEFKKQKKV
jgi:hypothetical protein